MSKIKKYILALVLAGFGFFGTNSDVKAGWGLDFCLASCGVTTLFLGYKTAKLMEQVRVRTLPEVDRSLHVIADMLEDAKRAEPKMPIGSLIKNAADAANTAAHPISEAASLVCRSAESLVHRAAGSCRRIKDLFAKSDPASSVPAPAGTPAEMRVPDGEGAPVAVMHGGQAGLRAAIEEPLHEHQG